VLDAMRESRGDFAHLLRRPRYGGSALTVSVALPTLRWLCPRCCGLWPRVLGAAALGGAIADPVALIDAFVALNLAAAGVVLVAAGTGEQQAAQT
jgi:hypothetical protein